MEENPGATAIPDHEISFLDLALSLAENWRTLVIFPLSAGLLALGVTFLIPPTYTAVTRFLPPAQHQSTSAALAAQLSSLAGIVGTGAGIKNPADQYVALLGSRSVLDAMVERFNLRTLYKVHFVSDARRQLDQRTTVSAGIRDGIIAIEVQDHDPKRAADMANAYVDELRNLTKRLAITEAAQRRLFFQEQLAQAKDNLTQSEIALQASGVSETALRTIPQSALESLARLKAQITAQEIKLASMRAYMTDANPEFRLGVQELSALRVQLSKAEQSAPVSAAGDGVEYIAKYRDFKYHETLFELMAKQYELARLDEAREGAVIQVIDAAEPPNRKSRPQRTSIAVVTTLIAFFGMVILVFARQAFRNLSANAETAEKVRRLRRLLSLRRS